MKEEIKMSIFTGAGVAIITPMNEDGSINIPKALRPYMGGKEIIK